MSWTSWLRSLRTNSKRTPANKHPRLEVERLEDRVVPAGLDYTTLIQQLKNGGTAYPHAGPTTLWLNFDGNAHVQAFSSAYSTDTMQDILFRTAEIFEPFNVNVNRIYGYSAYDQSNVGNTTVLIGDDINNYKDGLNTVRGYTAPDSADFPTLI